MAADIAGQSHAGVVRDTNQDRVAWHLCKNHNSALMVVADGMGGYQGGEIASGLATEAIMEALVPELELDATNTDDGIWECLQTAFFVANERILERRAMEAALKKMGTTLVVAWLAGDYVHVSHVGDSRCYLHRNRRLSCLTRDDTVVQNMLDDGSITEADAPNVPFRNILTRAVGALTRLDVSYCSELLQPGDKLLLCSDGLTNAVTDSDLEGILNIDNNASNLTDVLIETALTNQASDNVSVVLLTLS
jgi:protein phosphatase